MKIVDWFKSKFKFKQVEPEYECPKCGCKDIAYFSVISNFVEVIRDTEAPKYIDSAKCTRCGFSVESTDKTHLKAFRKK